MKKRFPHLPAINYSPLADPSNKEKGPYFITLKIHFQCQKNRSGIGRPIRKIPVSIRYALLGTII
jgi:hypothetical protein